MKAVVVDEHTPHKQLTLREIADPQCDHDSVIVRVHAAGVNRADLLQRAGKYPPPPGTSPIIGLEVSGVVESVGKNVTQWSVGDRVCALLAGGGYAEKVAVPAAHIFLIPPGFSFEQAAALPEAFLTAYVNLCREGRLASHETVLIHGGSSGVGTAAIQIARRVGARVACTVGSEAKAARCRELGAELAINYSTEDFESRVREWAPDGVNLVLDMIGKDYLAKNLSVLALCGRLVMIATMSGARAEIDLALLMRKRLTLVGSVLRSRSLDEKAKLVADFSSTFLPDFTTGALRPVIDSVFAFSEVEKAHARMQSSAHVGKIILQVV